MVLTGISILVYIAFNNTERRADALNPESIGGDTGMRKSRLIGAAAVALSAVAATSGVAAAQHVAAAQGPERAGVHFPGNGPGGQDSHTCFWGVSYTQETRNIVWPDSHTDYPVSTDTIPAGGKIVLHGRFPHARFFSLTASSPLGQLRGHLYDVDIHPDSGSSNRALTHGRRRARLPL
jgi:hypothetical protein